MFKAPFEEALTTGKPIIGPQDIFDVSSFFQFA